MSGVFGPFPSGLWIQNDMRDIRVQDSAGEVLKLRVPPLLESQLMKVLTLKGAIAND